jgi:GNAT superfamily N-acetyltransferase
VSRRLHDLTIANLDDLPEACRSCVFWEDANAERGPAGAEARAAKEAWVSATQLEWGAPGKVVYVDDEPVAYGLLAPGRHIPRARRLGHQPSEDALLLTALWIAPDLREAGLAKVLLHALLRETSSRGAKALEAYGVRHGPLPSSCVLPEGFLVANGFTVLHEHPLHPLLRLDLRTTVRWQESVSGALEQALSALAGRERTPAPARPNAANRLELRSGRFRQAR